MFLFQKHHIDMIRAGNKTQTRRNHKAPRARLDSVHQCRTELFGRPHCHIHIIRVWQERLGDISREDAINEGGYDRDDYISGLIEMHKGKLTVDSLIWCYEFELVEEVRS